MMALEGIKVLDLTRLLPGPVCSMMLADYGADVLKVEDTTQGDHMRWIAPFAKEEGLYYLAINRNKKSIKVNLKTPEGKEIFKKLVQQSDVVLESFRPGVMDRLGLGYTELSKINPRLVYCALSGFGQNGPNVNRVGHDINYLALGGLLGFNGPRGGAPTPPGVQIADLGAGTFMCVFGILTALLARNNTGKGQYVDVSMFDGVIFWLAMQITRHAKDGENPTPGMLTFTGKYPSYTVYETKDKKYISLGNVEFKFWENFCKAINREDLIKEHLPEGEKLEEVLKTVQDIFKSKTRAEWEELLNDVETCFEPVYEISEVIAHPQVKAREMIVEQIHPVEGTIREVGFPVKFSATPASLRMPPPRYGEHTELILQDLGYDTAVINDFRNKGII